MKINTKKKTTKNIFKINHILKKKKKGKLKSHHEFEIMIYRSSTEHNKNEI